MILPHAHTILSQITPINRVSTNSPINGLDWAKIVLRSIIKSDQMFNSRIGQSRPSPTESPLNEWPGSTLIAHVALHDFMKFTLPYITSTCHSVELVFLIQLTEYVILRNRVKLRLNLDFVFNAEELEWRKLELKLLPIYVPGDFYASLLICTRKGNAARVELRKHQAVNNSHEWCVLNVEGLILPQRWYCDIFDHFDIIFDSAAC